MLAHEVFNKLALHLVLDLFEDIDLFKLFVVRRLLTVNLYEQSGN
jgi:hypothetical protein